MQFLSKFFFSSILLLLLQDFTLTSFLPTNPVRSSCVYSSCLFNPSPSAPLLSSCLPGTVMSNKVSVSKKVRVETLRNDQAGRAASTQSVTEMLSDKIVLVTGAGGSIGSELVRQVSAAPVRTASATKRKRSR